jgi:hypothetical protein
MVASREFRNEKTLSVGCRTDDETNHTYFSPAGGALIRCGTFTMRVTRLTWTPDQITQLLSLIERGVSPARASVVLRRPKLAVQNKARQLGKPFRDVREVKAARLAREAGELEAISRQDSRSINVATMQFHPDDR